jgi:uncharacterized protein YbbC (DUF1343 family)
MNILAGLSGKPLAWTDEDFYAIYGYTSEQMQEIREDPEFTKSVHLAVQELKESGGSLKQKSRLMLEHYVDELIPAMLRESLDVVPAKDKTILLAFLGKLSGMDGEAKAKEAQQSANNNQQNVPIFKLILQSSQPLEPKTITIDQEPL